VKNYAKGSWSVEAKRRQCYLWTGFALLILSLTIVAIILINRFTSGFRNNIVSTSGVGGNREEIDEHYLSGKTSGIKLVDQNRRKRPSGQVLLTFGGHVVNGESTSVEVVSQSGVCTFPEGYPAKLPTPRIGHTAGVTQSGLIIICGGFVPGSEYKQIAKQNRNCYSLDPKQNRWSKLPSLIKGVSYASGTVVTSSQKFLIIGGFSGNDKVNYIQVRDTLRY
jgi:hypothetical protein